MNVCEGYRYECQDKCPYWDFCSTETKETISQLSIGCDRKTFIDWVLGGFDNLIISTGKSAEILNISIHEFMDLMKATGRKY